MRFNLSQQPMAFAEHLVVKRFLDRSGVDALPVFLVDGEIALAGRQRAVNEMAQIHLVATHYATRYAIEPIGVARLRELSQY